ncbi:peptidoglycan-binding protein [Devosia sp. A8/3-2]|nr:peptidoglycan-binding protein [Devosia sp. A8/3-2]
MPVARASSRISSNPTSGSRWRRSGDADAGKARDDIAKSLTADAIKRLSSEITGWTAEPIDLTANFAPLGTRAKDFDPGRAISTKDVVSKVQQALVKLGFDVGTPDGLAGPKTAEAIKSFETGTGMAPSGKINPRLLGRIGQPARLTDKIPPSALFQKGLGAANPTGHIVVVARPHKRGAGDESIERNPRSCRSICRSPSYR